MAKNKQLSEIVNDLDERAKELRCLYKVENILNNNELKVEELFLALINVIPSGWQYPHLCQVKIIIRDMTIKSENYEESKIIITKNISVRGKVIGEIAVSYTAHPYDYDREAFLSEESNLLKTIADRIGHYVLHHDLNLIFKKFQNVSLPEVQENAGEWKIILDMLRKTDPILFMSILRKLLHNLVLRGSEEAEILMSQSSISIKAGDERVHVDENRPLKKKIINNYDEYINAILKLTSENFEKDEILLRIQKWMQEEKSIPLVRILEARESTLAEISDAIRKYYHLAPEKFELSPSIIKGLRVSLVRRFFTEDLNYIGIAKEFVKLTDFYKLIDKMIYQPTSQGKLGGKSSGVFIASNILEKRAEDVEILRNIKIPKTWFVASDCVLSFMRYNNLEEVLEQKYKELNELRLEYPLLVQLFKNSEFPPEIEKGLAAALDDFGDTPLIVRSSSLLEDQMGASFSGKYKSLFLANQGSKEDRLDALKDAVAEVYASTFAPDPIEYRAERGLLDFHEEMGVMIQEVVGNKIGKYYFPSYAGVAFSNNEFRWSTRIKREDGLVRIVPGLGTRAVDRVGDDYPILMAPGQPDLSVNMTLEDSLKYSQKRMDVINLESNEFETISIDKMVKEYAENYPGLKQIISIVDQHRVRQPNVMDDIASSDYVVTFDGLVKNTRFVKKMNEILKTLQDSLTTPVDIEFASDGKDFYILQCRPQSKGSDLAPDTIPTNIPDDKVIFSANKHISNGKVPEITHIVYVDPVKYGEIPDIENMKKVGRAVGKLNTLLPRKKFILMGPGRWGSRGDIKLGVNVTYSDISNSAVLLEIAKKKGNYVPDLSFGTHFFQDLVEASIRYIPLYPDDKGIKFNEEFLTSSKNIFEELIPDYKKLAEVIKVIDVPNSTKGKILKIMVNADNNEALAFISEPGADLVITDHVADNKSDHWKWRLTMVENLASRIDGDKFGIKEMYVFGSTFEGTAGPGSDIDLVFHVDQNEFKKDEFSWWLTGWSDALSEMNYIRTGYKSNGLLDIHYVNDDDIKKKNSYVVYIKSGAYKSKKLKMMSEFK